MIELMTSLQALVVASWNVVVTLLGLILPWTPLIAWVAFWSLAVNWVKVRQVMIQGGWIGVLLMGLMMILVWGVVAPPASNTHYLFGLNVSNFVGKTVYVTALLTIMFLCGSVQLSGAFGKLTEFPEDAPDSDSTAHGHDAHGNDAHGGHGIHGDHAPDSHGTAHPVGH